MTIDEVISKYKEKAKFFKQTTNIAYGLELEQIAEWLEELKFLRQWKSDVMDEFCKYDCNSVEEARHNAYNKAIDDFVAFTKEHEYKYGNADITSIVIGFNEFIAQQLKEGGLNE